MDEEMKRLAREFAEARRRGDAEAMGRLLGEAFLAEWRKGEADRG